VINEEDNVAATRGYASALGVLPAKLLKPSLSEVIDSLGKLASPTR
jgi:hypothetical protein